MAIGRSGEARQQTYSNSGGYIHSTLILPVVLVEIATMRMYINTGEGEKGKVVEMPGQNCGMEKCSWLLLLTT